MMIFLLFFLEKLTKLSCWLVGFGVGYVDESSNGK